MFGEFKKLQKICNKMRTRIFKIDGEMPEIIEPKVGNPKNSTNPNWADLSQPWNLTFLKDEIFKLFFQSYVPKVPEWKIAHIEWSKKAQNIRKSPKNKRFRGTYCIPPFWEHPVDIWYLDIYSNSYRKLIFRDPVTWLQVDFRFLHPHFLNSRAAM